MIITDRDHLDRLPDGTTLARSEGANVRTLQKIGAHWMEPGCADPMDAPGLAGWVGALVLDAAKLGGQIAREQQSAHWWLETSERHERVSIWQMDADEDALAEGDDARDWKGLL